ncbi:MAG: hypothetical protein WKF94_06795 [Solirubrobacteraceae bacterium]
MDDLGDPQRLSNASVQLMRMLEAARLGRDPACYDMVSEPLRARYLTREEAERVVARLGEEMQHAGRRPDAGPSLATLAGTLTKAGVELALPPLLQALAANWKTATADDIEAILNTLERVLWGVCVKPSALVVEQIRAHPQLRRTLRRIALRDLDAVGKRSLDMAGLIEMVDGYVATVLAAPELRQIRRRTFAVRQNDGGVLRAVLVESGQPIARCVIDETTEEREDGSLDTALVLAPKGRIYRLETETADGGYLHRAVWTTLHEQEQIDHRHTIELLQRVRALEEEERQHLGRIPTKGPRS